jgi:hypothetical protein
MKTYTFQRLISRLVTILLSMFLLLAPTGACAKTPPQTAARTPTEVVREFYKALREKRFREAFALSIFKPAIEALSAEEFEELRPDFEKIAATVPEKVEISGEQVSGDTATVFVKILEDGKEQLSPVLLLRVNNSWIVGDRDGQEKVRQSGKEYFLKARIDTHHAEVQAMLLRIAQAQLVHSSQHNGMFADLETLTNAGLVPQDILTTESTGYRFHLTLSKDGRSYTVGAEPARYGSTGRLSFHMDKSGVQSKDTGGKPLKASSAKK